MLLLTSLTIAMRAMVNKTLFLIQFVKVKDKYVKRTLDSVEPTTFTNLWHPLPLQQPICY